MTPQARSGEMCPWGYWVCRDQRRRASRVAIVVTDLEEGGWVRVMVMVAGRGAPARRQAPAAPLPRHKVGHDIGIMGFIS